MTDTLTEYLPILAAVAIAYAAMEAYAARRSKRQAYDALRRALAAKHADGRQKQTIADLVDALTAMQSSAEAWKVYAESLKITLDETRADCDRYAMAAQELHEREQHAQALYLASVQQQLSAGCRIVFDHPGKSQ